jgi:glucose-1-phosphate thymidylyltransferase
LGEIAPEKVVEYYGDGSKFGVKITYIHQGAPRGLAHAVDLCRNFIGDEPFVVYLGDNLIHKGISKYVEDFQNSKYDAGLLLAKVDDPQRYGVVQLDELNRVIGVEEKPKVPKSNFVIVGVYFFTSCIFDAIKCIKPSWRNELEITDAIGKLLSSKKYKIASYFVDGWWDDTGTAEDILKANRYVIDNELKPLNLGKVEDNVSIEGRVYIDEGTIIRQGRVIRGPVCIGKSCDIGPRTYIGPYTSIGDKCILKNANIESSVFLEGVTIDCEIKIIDSLVGKDVQIISKDDLPQGTRFILGENCRITL